MMKTVITAISAENVDNKKNNDAPRRCEIVLSLLEFDRAIFAIRSTRNGSRVIDRTVKSMWQRLADASLYTQCNYNLDLEQTSLLFNDRIVLQLTVRSNS